MNQFQKQRLLAVISAHFGGASGLAGRRFAEWGLAFKPNTDDMREAHRLDPSELADDRLALCDTKEAAAEGADALMLCTEWKRFMAANFEQLASGLRQKLIFDGRNLYDPEHLAEQGWTDYAIGRGASVRAVA